MSSIITKIELQKRNKNRVNIYMNEEFAFACDSALIYIHNITRGRVMEKEQLEDIANEDNYIKAKSFALHFLERSAKSSKQVVDKLIAKEFDVKTIDRVVEFLKSYDFIDDNRFVELFIKEKIRSSGKNKIKFTLLKKGLPKEIIEEGLNKITSEEQAQTALQLGERKIIVLAKSEMDSRKLYKKTADYLGRSGFDFGIINEIMDKIMKNYNMDESNENASIENASIENASIENASIENASIENGAHFGQKPLIQVTYEENYRKLYELANKRFNVLIKSESEEIKLYKKLGDYLLRRGFQWDVIKKVLRDLISGVEE